MTKQERGKGVTDITVGEICHQPLFHCIALRCKTLLASSILSVHLPISEKTLLMHLLDTMLHLLKSVSNPRCSGTTLLEL
jgi:hypothetical protein